MPEYDNPWKEVLDCFFEQFMQLCFPSQFTQIDWTVPAKMLDKELQRIAPQSEVGLRVVDKLVEVQLLSGKAEWVLIHLEIQSQVSNDLAKRIFVYFYRISDKYNKPVVSLAILGDENPNWRPTRFEQETLGCRVELRFPMVKLLDFMDRLELLENSCNPFATVILAHLMTMKTEGSPSDRCRWKLNLLRPLYQRGLAAEEIRQMFKFIDWMMELPEKLAIEFNHELEKIEMENMMPYVTSIERMALKRGIEQGIEQGIERGIEQGIERGVLAGQIVLLQDMLGKPCEAVEELVKRSSAELCIQLEQLRDQMRKRDQ